VSIATGKATTADVRNFETAIRRLFYLSEYAGYTWQATNAGHRITTAGISQLVSAAKKKGTTVADSLTDYLGNNPMLMGLVKESILGQSVVLEGVGIGQLQTADEAGLGFKTWIHTGVSDEPRQHHLAMNGTTIPKDELFRLPNGVSCSAPHDWGSAGASEWNFCGCQVIYTNSR
jgi:hypothetical protein